MLAIVDKRAPLHAIKMLRSISSDLLLFESNGITYNSISCHPDIFIYKDDENIILAPNSPGDLPKFLEKNNVSYKMGAGSVGYELADSVKYNCLSTADYWFHKKGFTDSAVQNVNKEKSFIDLPQAYTRCSLIHIGDNHYITSDKGIEKVMLANGLPCFWFDPSEINIHDHEHGFIGGTCGVYDKSVYFLGNVLLHKDGAGLKEYIEQIGYQLITLCDEKLYDGGGIFFI